MINNELKEYDTKFINSLILKSKTDMDEQSAVGMEIIDFNNYMILEKPEYHHGGWNDQSIDFDKLELIHMQGRAVGYRNNLNFINNIMRG
jgi:hypothetical protein